MEARAVWPGSGQPARPAARMPHEHEAGTVTTTATVSGGRPARLPLAEPTTLVSMPATVDLPVTTENDAVASVSPGHSTWYSSDHRLSMWNESVLADPWPDAVNCRLGATGTRPTPASTGAAVPAAGPAWEPPGAFEPLASAAPAPKHATTAIDAATAATVPEGTERERALPSRASTGPYGGTARPERLSVACGRACRCRPAGALAVGWTMLAATLATSAASIVSAE